MEIHPPHRITSLKEFLRELVTITVGILIALSLEGLLEWRHQRNLVHEARANIVSELNGNRSELLRGQQDLDKMEKELRDLIALIHAVETDRRTPVKPMPYIWSITELHTTSWDTAQSTGALSYMDYPEVKRYASVYDLQREFQALEQRGFSASLDVEGLASLLTRDPATLTPGDLSDAERKLGVAQADVMALQEVSQSLQRLYDQTLSSANGR